MGRLFFALLLALSLEGLSYGAVDRVTLEGKELWEGAKAEVVIEDLSEGSAQKELRLEADGLRPGAVYSVWLVNESLSFGKIGLSLKEFTSDKTGHGSLDAVLPVANLSDWDSIQIAYHPDGNPENLQSASFVLEGEIEKQP